jgi:hypothetical protein
MNHLATLWSDLPLPAELIAALAAAGIITLVALPHVRRMYRRRQWRKLPPPPKPVEEKELDLRLPRRGAGNQHVER